MPNPGEYLLDSNAIISLLRGDPAFSTAVMLVLAIAIGELYFGAFKSTQVQNNIAKIDTFVAGAAVLNSDVATSRVYGLVKQRLRVLGRPIPENDIWIAAAALQHNLILVTRDAHFQNVQDLVTQSW